MPPSGMGSGAWMAGKWEVVGILDRANVLAGRTVIEGATVLGRLGSKRRNHMSSAMPEHGLVNFTPSKILFRPPVTPRGCQSPASDVSEACA